MVYASLKSPEAINAYSNFARFGMLIIVGFFLLGGFRIIILPVVGLFYSLLGLPLPALTIEQTKTDTTLRSSASLRSTSSEYKNKYIKGK